MVIEQSLNNQLNEFPENGRQHLSQIVLDGSFAGVISADQVQTLENQTGLSTEELMHALVPIARCFSHPPISQYFVGAVVLGSSGNLYFGGNLEFPGLGLNMTVHGEQSAVVNARLNGETGIDALAVNGTPCGHCRQFLAEINNPNLTIIYPKGGKKPLSDVLPDAFTPIALGNKQGLLDSAEGATDIQLNGPDELMQVATTEALKSYAPYSGNQAGMAARLRDGQIVAAPYLENAAFNPTLSPLQNILVLLSLRQQSGENIADAVLVEKQGSMGSQKQMCEALLATLGDVELRYHTL